MKRYNVMYGIGRSKYMVNYHDGVKTHKDGSPFFDIAIFKSLKALNGFISSLKSSSYIKM